MNLISSAEPRHFLAALQRSDDASSDRTSEHDGLRGSMAFDRAGRLVGVVADDGDDSSPDRTVHVLAAADVIGAAEQLIAAHD
jgi:hypothetical protein